MPGIEIQGGDSNLGAPDSQPRKVWFTGYANDETTQGTSVPVLGGVVITLAHGASLIRSGGQASADACPLSLFNVSFHNLSFHNKRVGTNPQYPRWIL